MKEEQTVEPRRSYWTFGANPKTYDIEGAVAALQTDYWTTRDKPLSPGDRIAFWRFGGRDGRRGFVALGEVLTRPRIIPAPEKGFWRTENWPDPASRVSVRYFPLPRPLWLADMPGLKRLAVARATGGSVFSITAEDWIWLLEVALGWPAGE